MDQVDPLAGVRIGHDTDTRRPTGVTVVLLPEGTVAGVDVRGASPGTRETDILDPVNTIAVAHAITLTGGSAYGLDAAGGVMQWLEERGVGVAVGPARVPIVPAAVIFDLGVGDPAIRPDAAAGYRACQAAVPVGMAVQGSVGAGAGASVGKLLGPERGMRGGLGVAVLRAGGSTMVAIVVVNAVGDVVDPSTGTILAGARAGSDSTVLVDTVRAQLAGAPGAGSGVDANPAGDEASASAHVEGETPRAASPAGGSTSPGTAGGATTIGVVVTDAHLSKAQAQRLAQVAHDGLARTIRPVHTPMDGDAIFAAGTGRSGEGTDMVLLSTMAAEVTAQAVVSAVLHADGLQLPDRWMPAARDLALGTG